MHAPLIIEPHNNDIPDLWRATAIIEVKNYHSPMGVISSTFDGKSIGFYLLDECQHENIDIKTLVTHSMEWKSNQPTLPFHVYLQMHHVGDFNFGKIYKTMGVESINRYVGYLKTFDNPKRIRLKKRTLKTATL
jgi:hypothetical protein